MSVPQRSVQLQDLPGTRRPEQRYVHWMFESPAHLAWDSTPLAKLNNFFNWSLSYRLDSRFPTPYGKFVQVKILHDHDFFTLLHELNCNQKKQTKSVGPELDKHILKFGEANIHLAKKTKVRGLAAVFVSNCHSRSGRENIIRELKK